MENNRLILFLAAALAILFPEHVAYIVTAALLLEVARRCRDSKIKENCDKQAIELLFRLGARRDITESAVVDEMKQFLCFEKISKAFESTGRLNLPNFGWRSFAAASAIHSALDTGNVSIITKALEQLSQRETAMLEARSMLASQKYTLFASIAVASAILGVASSISGQSYLYYVVIQSFLSGIWLKFLGGNLYESLSLSVPLSLTGYFLALRFI